MNLASNEITPGLWSVPWESVAKNLETDVEAGLKPAEVKKRMRRFGPNQLREAPRTNTWLIFIAQFKSILVLMLTAAAVISFLFGEIVEAIAILTVIAINAAIGFFTELRAVRSMEALQQLSRVETRVRREGQGLEIPAEQLVPGDIVLFEGGDVVTADLRLIEASKLQADESTLTGESVPVGKQVEPLEDDTSLAERSNMVFKGTAITRGTGEGIVVSTGMDTELGRISSLVEEAEQEVTPLEKRLDQLGHKLVWATLIIAGLVAVIGILVGKEVIMIIETSIALAVATVPEGLPIVATLALGRGMLRMSRRNALIRRLSAVETLGSTTVICTDKTGTLTENRMTVVRIALEHGDITVEAETVGEKSAFHLNDRTADLSEGGPLYQLLQTCVLCNNARLSPKNSEAEVGDIGDPLEIALLVAGAKAGVRREDSLAQLPEVREIAFDPEIKRMATFHKINGRYLVAVKGAPEAVLSDCSRSHSREGIHEIDDRKRERWMNRNQEMAKSGLRILALATREVDDPEDDPYQDLILLGMVGLLDPPRVDVNDAITACKEAGIRVVMVTGDQPQTAQNISGEVNLTPVTDPRSILGKDLKKRHEHSKDWTQELLETSIFARVDPKQKLDLITAFQDTGEIVAMTGDGVNDAPALKKADIGIAMGERGTQVAHEAADMVLKDDAFSSIVAAIEMGRAIFNNIRNFVFYLLSCNVSEILVISLASLVNVPLPIRPLQILYLNLVTDVFPALALGVGGSDPSVMKRPPREPDEPILTGAHWKLIGGYSFLISMSVLGAFGLALFWLDQSPRVAVTISFLTLASSQLWHVFNMRSHDSQFLHNEITTNIFIWIALVLCVGLLIAAVYLPGLSDLLHTSDPGQEGWALVFGTSLIPWVAGQTLKAAGFGKI